MGTYSIEEQRRMDQVDLTDGKMGSGYMVSIRLEEYKALKDAVHFVKAFLTKLEDDGDYYDPLAEARKKFHAPLHAKLDAALALVAKEGK